MTTPTEMFQDYKKSLMPIAAITIGNGTKIDELLSSQMHLENLSMYILPTTKDESISGTLTTHSFCVLSRLWT